MNAARMFDFGAAAFAFCKGCVLNDVCSTFDCEPSFHFADRLL